MGSKTHMCHDLLAGKLLILRHMSWLTWLIAQLAVVGNLGVSCSSAIS